MLQICPSDNLSDTVVVIKICNCTVDGTNFKIQEPAPLSTKLYYLVFCGTGVCNKVGIPICSGRSIWAHGPFLCGRWPDINIFNKNHEVFECKWVSSCTQWIKKYKLGHSWNFKVWRKECIRSHHEPHETCNTRFKRFTSLRLDFQHNVQLNGSSFRQFR